MRMRLALGVVLAATSPSIARAQSSSTAPAPAVTMPVAEPGEGALYPAEALEAGIRDVVDVPLLVTVDPTGAVTKVEVEKPAGHGFDEAAMQAVRRTHFRPATRGGKPVAARIRFVYRFAPPPGALAGRVVGETGEKPVAGASVVVRDAFGTEHRASTASDGTWKIADLPAGAYHVTVTAAGMAPHEANETIAPGQEATSTDRLAPVAPAAAPQEQVQEEVEVHGKKPPREVTKRTLDQRELERIPGTNGDALRSLQNLPGVARPPAFLGLLIVRGSAPEDTQYFVDGTPVPIVYHFGGLSSVVPTEMIDRLDFYPGNFSTQYGRAMGGIVDVGLADPKSDKLHVMAQADFIDTRLVAQGPLFDTGWKLAIAGRRSWFDTWLAPVLQASGAGVSVAPVYYDWQAVLERDLGSHQNVRFAFFGSDDRLDLLLQSASASQPELAGTIGSHMGFWRGQVRYVNTLAPGTELRVVGAVGEDTVEVNAGDIYFDLTEWPITSRVELAQKLDPHVTLNVGADVYYAPYSVSAQLPPPPKPGQPPPGPFGAQPPLATSATGSVSEPALYAELEMTPWKGGRLVPGLRLDYTDATRSWDLAPRVVARQDVTRHPRTTIKGGAGIFAQPPQPQETNAVFGRAGLVSNRATHYDVGVEREITRKIDVSVDGFYKQLDYLVEPGLGNTGSGQVYGAETLVRYEPDERFFGWIAYTLSRSLRRIEPGAPLEVFQFDETHILTVLGSYRLGRGWEIGARYRLTSGWMYTPDGYGFYDENVGTYLPLATYPPYGSRLPLFHALDVRVDKSWIFGWGTLHAYLDVLNIYDQGNVDGVEYDYDYTHQAYVNDLPIIPSLGLRVEN